MRFRALRILVAVAVALVATVLSIWAMGRLQFDASLGLFRPVVYPALRGERLLAEEFAIGMDTTDVVVPADDLAGALDGAETVKAIITGLHQTGVKE